MAELNEEQLLLLDNLMYYSGSAEHKYVWEIAEDMIENARQGEVSKFSGGFESNMENAEAIGKAILNDPELCSLIVGDSINTEGVRASCFVDESGEATIAIRGTGGYYEPWVDNFQGAYQSDTTDQKALAAFVNEQAEDYANITITGHSKGGNLAQYATVVCGDKIDRCVSFDGQGFGDEFLEKYEKEIKANRGKIKSVCAEGDFVNILLFSIAGETVYLETGTIWMDNHSSYYLWKKNAGKMKNGAFSETVEQSILIKIIDKALDDLVRKIDKADPIVELILVNVLGGMVGNLMSGAIDFSLIPDIRKQIENAYNFMNNTRNHIIDLINDSRSRSVSVSCYFISVDTGVLDRSLSEMEQCVKRMEAICDTIDAMKLDGELKLLFNSKLKKYKYAIENEANNMRSLKNGLREIYFTYENTENNIAAQMG